MDGRGITGLIKAIEQITYLMFMKLSDDSRITAESDANILGVSLKGKVFGEGICVISQNPLVETDYTNLRGKVFGDFEPNKLFANIRTYVFPFIKNLSGGRDTAFPAT